MRGAQCKERSTLGCTIIANKIFIIRATFHGPRWAPALVHAGRLRPGLALSSFCRLGRMLVALACFCPSSFLPDKLLLSCASGIGLTCLCSSALLLRAHLVFVWKVLDFHCRRKYCPQLTPPRTRRAFGLAMPQVRSTANGPAHCSS